MIKPLGTRVLLKEVKQKETNSGIIITTDNDINTPKYEVIVVGPDVTTVEPGDIVFCVSYTGTILNLSNEEYIVALEDNIIAKVSK